MRKAGPHWRELIAGVGVVVAWGLAGAGAWGSSVEAATWALAGYLAGAAFFLLGVLPELGFRDARHEKPSRRWWAFVLGVALLARLAVLPLAPSDVNPPARPVARLEVRRSCPLLESHASSSHSDARRALESTA